MTNVLACITRLLALGKRQVKKLINNFSLFHFKGFSFNLYPFTPRISLLILFTVCHTVLTMLV